MGCLGRFAPTPSGRMHLGNVFSAMMAWLSARSQGGGVLLSMLITMLVMGAGAALVIFLGAWGAAALCLLLLLVAWPIRLIMGKRAEKMLTKL